MRILALLLPALLLVGTANAKPRSGPGDWYLGFGLGNGQASITFDNPNGEIEEDYDDFFQLDDGLEVDSVRVSVSVEGGVRVAPRFFAGLHLAGISQSGEIQGTTITVGHSQLLGVVTYFPNRKGVFLRGGLGAATVNLTINIPNTDLRIRAEENGTGAMLGAGYALPITRSAHFTITFDVHAAAFDGDPGSPTVARFGTIQLGFTWF